jgi:hypothetical protein
MNCVKLAALLLCSVSLLFPQYREGNFNIRFEPTAVLQTGAEIPFAIHVTDDRKRPLIQASVTLQIETQANTDVKVFKAPETEPGVYVAKPVFPSAGQWSVYVEVHREGELSARTIDYNVPDSAAVK